MDLYSDLVYWLNRALIGGLFISVLVIILFHLALRTRVNIKGASVIVGWIIIIYSSLAFISHLLLFVAPPSEEYRVWERATGPYWWAYLITIVSHSVLPLILMLIKRRRSLWFLFSLSVIINLGWLLESFVIHTTSIHMDYAPWESDYNPYLPNPTERLTILRGFVLGIVILLAANKRLIVSVIKRKFQNR